MSGASSEIQEGDVHMAYRHTSDMRKVGLNVIRMEQT